MKIIDLLNNKNLLKEAFILSSKEWGNIKTDDEYNEYANDKINNIINGNDNKLISILGLVDNDILIGFISLLKYDGDERKDLTPWYGTMYVKLEYRKKGYSKLLNDAILNKAKFLSYDKVYLKSNLINYYEKFGAIYLEDLSNGEKLYYIDLK